MPKLPHITIARFGLATVLVSLVSLGIYFAAPQEFPSWVNDWRIPLWFARYWPLGVPVAFVGFTVILYKLRIIQDPPAGTGSQHHHPEMSNAEWKRFQDSPSKLSHLGL